MHFVVSLKGILPPVDDWRLKLLTLFKQERPLSKQGDYRPLRILLNVSEMPDVISGFSSGLN